MSDIPKGFKRVERPDASTIRGRLELWIENPNTGDGSYIDTLEPLVKKMIREAKAEREIETPVTPAMIIAAVDNRNTPNTLVPELQRLLDQHADSQLDGKLLLTADEYADAINDATNDARKYQRQMCAAYIKRFCRNANQKKLTCIKAQELCYGAMGDGSY